MSLIAYRPVAVVLAKDRARDRAIESLRFAPTPATAARLASHRLVFRPVEGGFRLSSQHDLESGGGALVPFAQPLPLLFAVRSTDARFVERYLDAEAAAAGPNLFLTNRSQQGAPQPGPGLSREEVVGAKDMARIVPRRHRARFRFAGGPRPNRIEVRRRFGGGAIGAPLALGAAAGAEAADVTVDLVGEPGLTFLLRPKPQGADRLILVDDELAQMKPLGALELVLKAFPGPAPAEGRAFAALFER